MSKFAALIVEDTPDIRGSYRRAIERQGGDPVLAATYDEAVAAVKRRFFPVAIIDVRLSEDDEANVDGLRVLEFIRKVGDETKAILITGYGTFQIAREAFRQHDVFEGLEKGVSLSVVEATIAKARRAFDDEAAKASKFNYAVILKGAKAAVWEWEDRAMRMSSNRSGADGLYHFLDSLLHEYPPLLQDHDKMGCSIDDSKKVAAGVFWSRGQGDAVLIAFGQKSEVTKFERGVDRAGLEAILFTEGPHLGSVLRKAESHGFYGIVRKVEDRDFSLFSPGERSR
jgi:ActR/RegA family two-component response regulator